MNTLQRFLSTNAIFSSLTGLLLMVFPSRIEQIFGIPQSHSFFLFLGILLLLFALSIVVEIKKQRALPILWIIIQDILWVLASIYLLIINPLSITTEGNILIAAVAMVVLAMAVGQTHSLSKLDETSQKGLKVLTFTRIVKGSKSKSWNLISDVSQFHKVAPNIDNSQIISGHKEAMVRSCSHGKDNWIETCLCTMAG